MSGDMEATNEVQREMCAFGEIGRAEASDMQRYRSFTIASIRWRVGAIREPRPQLQFR